MLPILCDRLRVTPDRMTPAAAHRWRYARRTQAVGKGCPREPNPTLYRGGDCYTGHGVGPACIKDTDMTDENLARL